MSRPGWVTAGVVGALQDIAVSLEVIGAANDLDPTRTAKFQLAVATGPAPSATTPAATAQVTGWLIAASALYNAIPLLVSPVTGIDPSVPAGLVALARGLGQAFSDPADAAQAFASAVDGLPDPTPPPSATLNRRADYANRTLIARFARMVFLPPYVEALTAIAFLTREDAITARADCVERFERQLEACGLASDIGVAAALTGMRDKAVAYLTQAVIDTRPILTVTAAAPLPALFMAWLIYADPTRAGDLIARNAIKTCELMPLSFEALAP